MGETTGLMTKRDKIKIVLFSILIGGLILVLMEMMFHSVLRNEYVSNLKFLTAKSNRYGQLIQRNLTNGIAVLEHIETILRNENFNPENFNTWGEVIKRLNRNVSVVQLAPDGVVRFSVPLQGNEGAIGHDLLKDPKRREGALQAIRTKTTTVIGPLKLIQNGKMAIIGRKPIFREINGEERFWGFANAIILIDDAVLKNLNDLAKDDIVYRLTGYDPDNNDKKDSTSLLIAASEVTCKTEWLTSYDVIVPNGLWKLELGQKKEPVFAKNSPFIHSGMFILAIISAILGYYYRKTILIKRKTIIQFNKNLIELNNTKDTFFRIIAHDLKSPLSTIIGFADIIANEEGSCKENKEYISVIQKSSYKLNELLENLLIWAQSQRGDIKFTPEEMDIKYLVNSNVELISGSANKKGISIDNQVCDSGYVMADQYMVNTILRNLLSNAIKFTYRGGKIEIFCEKRDKEYVIFVKDNGTGMDQTTKENIFSVENKIHLAGTENEPSTGLGLVLCREFTEKHKGKISVESTPGQGSTFSFTLPAA